MPSDGSLTRTASWVIIRTATGEAIFETFNASTAAQINQEAYRALPILEYLQTLNRAIAKGDHATCQN